MIHISDVSTSEQNESCSGLGLGFDVPLQKAGPVLGLSMGLDKPAPSATVLKESPGSLTLVYCMQKWV